MTLGGAAKASERLIVSCRECYASMPETFPEITCVVGLAWYRREDWEGLRRLYPDRGEMHDSFDDWLAVAEQTEQFLKSNGFAVKRVIVDPAELAGWCAARGLEPIAKARAEYVTEKTRGSA
jgi:hypothetical protein